MLCADGTSGQERGLRGIPLIVVNGRNVPAWYREGERVLRRERYHGAISRSFALASEIDEERATASYENGVLNLTLPKRASAASKRLKIK